MIKKICVCGAGTMGSGIAQVCAQAGYRVIQFDLENAALERSRNAIMLSLQLLVSKNKITEAESEATLSRIAFVNNLTDCIADLVIEAVVEKQQVKIELFKELERVNTNETVFATNTSSIPIVTIAEKLQNPERLAGLHFFNPAQVMRLVEVVRSVKTSDQVVEQLLLVVERLGKTAVVCKDVPGFIVNRVARPYYLEALRLVSGGLCTIETVDQVMEASGFKLGPFKLMDMIGLDVNYQVSQIVWSALEQPERLQPSELQQQLVEAGTLGKKTNQGFYTYSNS